VVVVADSVNAPGPSTDLSLSVSPATPQVANGAQITFNFTVTNNGPSPATNVTLSSSLPANLTFVSAFASQGTCSQFSPITCQLGTISTGNSLLIQVTATANAVGVSTEAGLVTATETDPVPNNNSASSNVNVTSGSGASTDVALTKTASPSNPVQGGSLTYTLTATNFGPNPATGVTITDTLPAGVAIASSAGCTGTTTLTCTIGNLA